MHISYKRVATDHGNPGKPRKTLFFQKVFENLEKSGKFFEKFDLTHHGKVREFSSEITFNPFSILSLSLRNSR